MTEIEYWKWRCTECKEEPRHTVYVKGEFITIGACKCNGPRPLEMVPMTKKKYDERINVARRLARR